MNKTLKPAISVDLKSHLIRIHRDTLRSIGNPDYILLLVNPNECSFAIKPSDRSDIKSHHIPQSSLISKSSFRIHSTSLIQNLRNLCGYWEDNKSYRIYGEKIQDENIVRFNMRKESI